MKSIKDIFNTQPPKKNKYKEDLYKIKKLPYKKDDMWQFNKLLKEKPSYNSFNNNNRRTRSGFRSSSRLDENSKEQRVTFKMSYSMSMQSHDKYIATYMPQVDKAEVTEKPSLFGTEEDIYEKNKVAKHFKCIISPDNQSVNLEVVTSEFIKRVEAMTGYKFYWQGCIHNDKEHKHAHVCLNGKDKNGKDVYFQQEMIERTMRETLSYVVTQMIGERTPQEIAAARQNMVTAKRWTVLDDQIEKYSGKIGIRNLNLNPEIQNRLAFLSTLNLAEKNKYYYVLKPEWKDVLIATGRYNTFFREYQNNNGKLELYAGGGIVGNVEKVITFDKDESWNDAVIVNDGSKRIYVPIYQLKKDKLEGKEIFIADKKRWGKIKDSDVHIVNEKEKSQQRKKIKSQEK